MVRSPAENLWFKLKIVGHKEHLSSLKELQQFGPEEQTRTAQVRWTKTMDTNLKRPDV